MKILFIALFAALTTSLHAGDIRYIVDPSGNNQIMWVERRGDTLYVTESDDMKFENSARRRSAERAMESRMDRIERLLSDDLLDW